MDDFVMEEKIIAAEQLPDGWEWHCHEGGTGELMAPNGKVYIKYNQIPFESEWRKYAENAEQIIKKDLEKGRVGNIDQQRVEDLLEGYAFIGIEQSTIDYILQNWDWETRLNLSGKAYFGLRFSGDLKNVDLSNARMDESIFDDIKLVGADLSGTDLRDVRFEFGYLKDVNFAGCNMAGAKYRYSHVEECDFSSASIQENAFYGCRTENNYYKDVTIIPVTKSVEKTYVPIPGSSYVGEVFLTDTGKYLLTLEDGSLLDFPADELEDVLSFRSGLSNLGKEVTLKHGEFAKAKIDISFDTPYHSLEEIGMLHEGDIVHLQDGDRIKVYWGNKINVNSPYFHQFEGENLDDPNGKDSGLCFNINQAVEIDLITRGQTYKLNDKELEHAKQMEPLIRQNFEECMRNGEDKPPKDDYSMEELRQEMPEQLESPSRDMKSQESHTSPNEDGATEHGTVRRPHRLR
ncbi:MAG: pentapeptide repeat-containing protein [Roseburia sp.]|nr:pentapeptide repeat-containing protein [Roseburia sp.]